ncbi:hypothetical protein QKU48_gp0350 [Fadolivirus algeromassiliense]|jgi:hypothetical protein|uniref:Uncharacterized protein n=1 Tax=Fadolivirus FV1/VV64 TaxID=3070911 RepID=A0A7D3UPC6_9VIRU|nr:hypothetical protein QKU48_gp0350 [Fadolivirus algeromassiliense]QKF93808.1 hypothetical protein Fadolivirus_1_350 [Fadolivirus FV1/VV64]
MEIPNILNNISILQNRMNIINKLSVVTTIIPTNTPTITPTNTPIIYPIIDPNDLNNQYIRTQLNAIPTGEFYLFSYGSNGIEQLTERLIVGTNNNQSDLFDALKNSSLAARVKGMRRGFFSKSINWRGEGSTPVATIYPENNALVNGIALKINKIANDKFNIENKFPINFINLMNQEAVNIGKYELKQINNFSIYSNGDYHEKNNGYAFIGNLNYTPSNITQQPSDAYIKAIARMLKDRRQKMNDTSNNRIKIDIMIRENGRWQEGRPKRKSINPNNI